MAFQSKVHSTLVFFTNSLDLQSAQIAARYSIIQSASTWTCPRQMILPGNRRIKAHESRNWKKWTHWIGRELLICPQQSKRKRKKTTYWSIHRMSWSECGNWMLENTKSKSGILKTFRIICVINTEIFETWPQLRIGLSMNWVLHCDWKHWKDATKNAKWSKRVRKMLRWLGVSHYSINVSMPWIWAANSKKCRNNALLEIYVANELPKNWNRNFNL